MSGKPWRIYPKGTGREDANWPIEIREAWAREDRLRRQLQAEKEKVARLRVAADGRRAQLPPWRQRSGHAA